MLHGTVVTLAQELEILQEDGGVTTTTTTTTLGISPSRAQTLERDLPIPPLNITCLSENQAGLPTQPFGHFEPQGGFPSPPLTRPLPPAPDLIHWPNIGDHLDDPGGNGEGSGTRFQLGWCRKTPGSFRHAGAPPDPTMQGRPGEGRLSLFV